MNMGSNSIADKLAAQLQRDIPTPLYYQMYVELKKMIDSGEIKYGQSLPTEQEICNAAGISRPTVRQAMQQLSNAGYITRNRSKGTYVRYRKVDVNYVAQHESFHDIILKHGLTPSTTVCEFRIVDPIPAINDILEIPPDEKLYSLLRLCYADGLPMLYCHTYLQASRFPGLLEYDFSNSSLYRTLSADYHTTVVTLKREIGAANASLSDSQVLQIKRGRAIFVVNNLAFDGNNAPVEYSVSYYRSETIKFTNYLMCT